MFLGSTAPVPSGARTRSGLGTRSHEDNAVAVRAAASPDPLAPTHANGSDDHPTGGEAHPACGGGRVDGSKSGLASAGLGPATAAMPGEGTHEDAGGRVAMASHASLSVLLRVLNMPETADVLPMVRLPTRALTLNLTLTLILILTLTLTLTPTLTPTLTLTRRCSSRASPSRARPRPPSPSSPR